MALNSLLKNEQPQPAGRIDFFPPFPTHVDQVSVSAVNADYTIPTDCKYVILSAPDGNNYACKDGGTAVYPAAGITNGSGSFLNPTQFDVSGVTTLGIIGDGAFYLTIACYN